jgi:hypothetical protein
MFHDVQFLNPSYLGYLPYVAAVVALMVAFNYWRKARVQRRFGDAGLLASTSRTLTRGRYMLRAVFSTAAVCFLLVALAQPVIPHGTKIIARGTLSIVTVVDVSRSMAAMDYDGKVPPSAVARPLIEMERMTNRGDVATSEEAGTRLEMVRHVLMENVLPALQGNEVGVVSYAGQPFAQAFITNDHKALRWVIDHGLTVTSAPGEGSAMGKAIELGIAMFDADAAPDHEKLLVLFSDGGNDDDPAMLSGLIQELRKRQIKLVVVALGNVMPSKIPVSKLAADDDYAKSLKDAGTKFYEVDGQPIKTGMDIALLKTLASNAGGEFVHLQQSSDLNMAQYVGRNSLQKLPGRQELFPWALMAAILCTLLSFGVTHEWRRRRS